MNCWPHSQAGGAQGRPAEFRVCPLAHKFGMAAAEVPPPADTAAHPCRAGTGTRIGQVHSHR